jgi:hypothetical protein
MRPMRSLVALALLLWGAAAADAPVVEEVVAVIRGPGAPQPRVVTRTRLEEEARIALVSRGGTAAATAPLDRAALRAALTWVVDQTLLGDEATRLQLFEVDAAEAEAELRRFRQRFGTPAEYQAFLARLDVAEEDLGAVLRRTLRVQRYVESRAGSSDPAVVERKVRAMVDDLRRRSEVRVLAADALEAGAR